MHDVKRAIAKCGLSATIATGIVLFYSQWLVATSKELAFCGPVCRMKTSKLKVIKAVLSLDYLLDEVGSMKWMKLNGAIVFYTYL